MNPVQFTNLSPPPTLSTKTVRLSENSSNKVLRNTLVNVLGLVLVIIGTLLREVDRISLLRH